MAIPQPAPSPPTILKVIPKTPLQRLFKKWQGSYIEFKPYQRRADKLEAVADENKAAAVKAMIDAGLKPGDAVEFEGSKISLQRRETVDVDALLVDLVNELGLHGVDVNAIGVDVHAVKARNTKAGEPYISAPASWSGKAS